MIHPNRMNHFVYKRWYCADWFSSNVLDSYLRAAQFESWTLAILTLHMVFISPCNKCQHITSINPWLVPCICLPVYHSTIIYPFNPMQPIHWKECDVTSSKECILGMFYTTYMSFVHKAVTFTSFVTSRMWILKKKTWFGRPLNKHRD